MLATTDTGVLQRSVMGSVDEVVEQLLSILRGMIENIAGRENIVEALAH